MKGPFKRIRQLLKLRKLIRKAKDGELDMKMIFDFIANLRTSTKSGFAGLVVPAVALIPFHDQINAYIVQACQSEEGPVAFMVGGAVVWVTMWVSARFSKTPAQPGAL